MKNLCLIGAAAGLLGSMVLAGGAQAAQSAPSAASSSAPASGAPSAPLTDEQRIKALERRLEQRDEMIRMLEERVDRLEQQEAARTGGKPAAPPTAVAQNPAPAAPKAPPPTPTPGAAASTAVAQAGTPAAGTPPAGAPAQGGPGTFTVSEEAAQRALERALVQSGAALLPRWKFELVPSVTYQFQQVSTPGTVALTAQQQVFITENVLRSTQVQASVLLRMGLPWDSQLEIGVPYDYKDNTTIARVGGAGLSTTGPNVHGFGDPSVALIKQIVGESDLHPGFFANVSYNPNVGQVKDTLPLGKGFNQLSAGFTAVKRQDPLVFTGGFSYLYSWENNGLRPGAQYIGSLGLLLAVSPETSLQFGQQLTFIGHDEFNGRSIPGSNRVQGLLTAGIVSVLGRNRVVQLTIGMGETPDAPDFLIQLSTPIRLN
jgi:hypothetical protein